MIPPFFFTTSWRDYTKSRYLFRHLSDNFSEYTEDLKFLKELFEAQKIQSVIDRCYPLKQIAEAHRYVDIGIKKENVDITVEQLTPTKR